MSDGLLLPVALPQPSDTTHSLLPGHRDSASWIAILGCSGGANAYALTFDKMAAGYITQEDGKNVHAISMARTAWNNADDNLDKPLQVSIIRSRSKWESQTEEQRLKDSLMEVDVWVKVDVGSIETAEWEIEYGKAEGNLNLVIDSNTVTSSEAVSLAQATLGESTTGIGLFKIRMPATQSQEEADAASSTPVDCNDDCGNPDNIGAGGCYPYICSYTKGNATADVPVQIYRVKLVPKGQTSTCTTGQAQDVTFSVHKVTYTNTADAVDVGDDVDCNDPNREPLQAATKDNKVKFTLTAQTTTTDAETKPWRVDIAGINQADEDGKDTQLKWDAGLQASSTVTIPETEHSQCYKDGTKFTCPPRFTNTYMCLALRDNEVGITGDFNNIDATRIEFYTTISDSANEWSAIGKGYKLECPTKAELAALPAVDQGRIEISCTEVSTQERTETVAGAPIASSVYCEKRETDLWDPTAGVGSTCANCLKRATATADNPDRKYFKDLAEYNTYCLADTTSAAYVPRKLLWVITTTTTTTNADMGCPVDTTTGSGLSYNNAGLWDKLPSFKLTILEDNGTINLSKRFNVALKQGPLPFDMHSGAQTASCAMFGQRTGEASQTALGAFPKSDTNPRHISYRVRDDEMTQISNNAELDRDTSFAGALFGEIGWSSEDGHVKIPVINRMHIAPGERALVNVGPGKCLTAGEAGMTIKQVWEKYAELESDSGNPTNPLVGTDGNVFGNCDLLSGANFPQGKTNAEMFKAVFGGKSLQLLAADYDTLSVSTEPNALFNFDHNTAGVTGVCTDDDGAPVTGAECIPYTMTNPRDLGSGNKWVVTNATMGEYGDDQHDKGFQAELAVTLEKLGKCRDRDGNKILTITQEAQGTKYSFNMHTTTVTAQRSDDVNHVHWSPICTERPYEITVSNTMFAMGGIQTTRRNNLYVDNMRYVDHFTESGTCDSYDDCVPGFGAEYTCPADIDEYSPETLKLFEYTVHLDMFDVSNQIVDSTGTATTVTRYYGLSAADSGKVEVNDDNCYGANIHSVAAAVEAPDGANGEGSTRTAFTFRTGCAELRPTIPGDPVADAFVTCNDPSKAGATDFSFRTRLWECTERDALAAPLAPANQLKCTLLPDWLHVHISLGFLENPKKISYEVEFETSMDFYSTLDHRMPNGDFIDNTPDANGVSPRDTWRRDNRFVRTSAAPMPQLTIDQSLVVSLGFVSGSPLEGSMTSAIRNVNMCRFKEHCRLEGISNFGTAVECTDERLFGKDGKPGTHSPFVQYATNQVLGSATNSVGCSEAAAAAGDKCPVTTKGDVAVPLFSCDRLLWEEFALAEAIAHFADKTILNEASIGTCTTCSLSVAKLVFAFDPTIESMSMVDHGMTSRQARDIHGSCEDEERTEIVTGENITARNGGEDVEIKEYLFPKKAGDHSSSGVCTCKSQQAANFKMDGVKTYAARADRAVIYAPERYNSSIDSPANLHLCKWQAMHQHKTYNTPLTSQDVFHMALKLLGRNKNWHLSIDAVLYDFNAFTAAGSLDSNNQFNDAPQWPPTELGSARRLLNFPKVAREGAAQVARKTDAARKTLSLMMPVAKDVTSTAVMPQGPVQMQQTTDASQPYNAGSMGGFVVVGPDDVAGQNNFGSNPAFNHTVSTTSGRNFSWTHKMDKEEMVAVVQDLSGDLIENFYDLVTMISPMNVWTGFTLLNIEPFEVDNVTTSFLTNYSYTTLMMPHGTREYIAFGYDNATGAETYTVTEDNVWFPCLQDIRPAVAVLNSIGYGLLVLLLSYISLEALDNFSMSMNGLHASKYRKMVPGAMQGYSVSFYRVPGTLMQWNFSGDKKGCLTNLIRVVFVELIDLLGGFYALNFLLNIAMWMIGAVLWITHRIVSCYGQESRQTVLRVWLQSMCKILLDYSPLQYIRMRAAYSADKGKNKQEWSELALHYESYYIGMTDGAKCMEWVKFIFMLLFRIVQVTFALALFPFSVLGMLAHYIIYCAFVLPQSFSDPATGKEEEISGGYGCLRNGFFRKVMSLFPSETDEPYFAFTPSMVSDAQITSFFGEGSVTFAAKAVTPAMTDWSGRDFGAVLETWHEVTEYSRTWNDAKANKLGEPARVMEGGSLMKGKSSKLRTDPESLQKIESMKVDPQYKERAYNKAKSHELTGLVLPS